MFTKSVSSAGEKPPAKKKLLGDDAEACCGGAPAAPSEYQELQWSASNVSVDGPMSPSMTFKQNARSFPSVRGGGMSKVDIRFSKALSYILRHGAESKGLAIRPDGYVKVVDLLSHPDFNQRLSFDQLVRLVQFNSKKRYCLARMEDTSMVEVDADIYINLSKEDELSVVESLYIRAFQGHSIRCIDSKLLCHRVRNPAEIPVCVHGTYWPHWKSVMTNGLRRMARLHIHFARGLPGDPGIVSGIRGNAQVAIFINVPKAMSDGISFWLSGNDVILTEGIDGILPRVYFSRAVSLPDRIPVPLDPDIADLYRTNS